MIYIICISINPNNNFILYNKLGTPGVDMKITILVLKILRTITTCGWGCPHTSWVSCKFSSLLTLPTRRDHWIPCIRGSVL